MGSKPVLLNVDHNIQSCPIFTIEKDRLPLKSLF